MILAGVLLAVVVVILVAVVRQGRVTASTGTASPVSIVEGDHAVVVLEVGDVDVHSEAATRLVGEVTRRAFAALPDVTVVAVKTSTGSVIGTRRRERPRQIAIPADLYAPPAISRAGPDLSELAQPSGAGALPRVRRGEFDAGGPHRPLAERFDLPASVRALIDDDDDPVTVVAAILRAAGHTVRRHGEVLVDGDTAVVVLRVPIGEPVGGELLSHAYHRFEDSGAGRGLVITPGFMNPAEVRRREVLAPAVLHAGPEGIQRMADAIALKSDPLRFAAAPPLATG